MGNYICNIRCSYRQPSGYCGITGGYETCQYRQLHHEENTVVGYVPPLKKTNADRIRAMTDEELADYFSELSCWPNAGREDCRGVANCMDCWLDWLKQEVSE